MSNDQYERKTQSQPIPEGSTADDIALAVKSILRVPFTVDTITIKAQPREIEYSVYLPKANPPDGVVLDPLPRAVGELMLELDVREVVDSKPPNINLKSMSVVSTMLMSAGREKLAGVGWLTGSTKKFCKWIGIKSKRPPARFLGLPLVEVSAEELPSDRLLLLCARSSSSDILEAEVGFAVAMTNIGGKR